MDALSSTPSHDRNNGTGKRAGFNFEEATQEQRRQIIGLLSDNHLPVGDITGSVQLYALTKGSLVVGAAGLERYGSNALLRSVCLDDDFKGKGLGIYLYQQLEHAARKDGVQMLYLLTTTAAPFFTKQGFQTISREEVPDKVAQSGQFNGICPTSATIMRKSL